MPTERQFASDRWTVNAIINPPPPTAHLYQSQPALAGEPPSRERLDNPHASGPYPMVAALPGTGPATISGQLSTARTCCAPEPSSGSKCAWDPGSSNSPSSANSSTWCASRSKPAPLPASLPTSSATSIVTASPARWMHNVSIGRAIGQLCASPSEIVLRVWLRSHVTNSRSPSRSADRVKAPVSTSTQPSITSPYRDVVLLPTWTWGCEPNGLPGCSSGPRTGTSNSSAHSRSISASL